jgi:hypothetical protein
MECPLWRLLISSRSVSKHGHHMQFLFLIGRFLIWWRKPKYPEKTTDLPLVTDKLCHIMYRVHLAWAGFELTTLVVIGTDGIDSCKSNYHTITTMTVPQSVYGICFMIYRITGNFCDVKFLRFRSKKKTFNFCGFFFLQIVNLSIEKKIVCITGSNKWSDVTINNWCTLQWSLEVKSYLVLQKVFKRYNFWIRIWLTSNLSWGANFSLFSGSILLTGNTKSTVWSISVYISDIYF